MSPFYIKKFIKIMRPNINFFKEMVNYSPTEYSLIDLHLTHCKCHTFNHIVKALAVSKDVKHGIPFSTVVRLIWKPSLSTSLPLVIVFITI